MKPKPTKGALARVHKRKGKKYAVTVGCVSEILVDKKCFPGFKGDFLDYWY